MSPREAAACDAACQSDACLAGDQPGHDRQGHPRVRDGFLRAHEQASPTSPRSRKNKNRTERRTGRAASRSARLGPPLPARALPQAAFRHAPLAGRAARRDVRRARARSSTCSGRAAGPSRPSARSPTRSARRVESREPYIWIVSDTKHQARAHLENLKAELLDNPPLAARLSPAPSAAGRVWRAGAIVLRNGVAIEAFGTGQRIRGRRHRQHRPTLIVCDDLQNDAHIDSAAQRERSRHVVPRHAAEGRHAAAPTSSTWPPRCTATPWRWNSRRTPGWISRVFRSIDRWPFEMALWEQWEAIYTDLRQSPGTPGGPASSTNGTARRWTPGPACSGREEEDLYTLMCMRAESGRTAFEREKQNSPVEPRAVRMARGVLRRERSGSTTGRRT